MEKYNHKKIEAKWQKFWAKHPKLFEADDKSQAEKQYILDMFPYPSSNGLHAGHVESYTATDIMSRYLRMKGKNVLHPQGWDAFGLPAENYAVKTKTHPKITTKKAIENFTKQMKMMGFSYDWSREVNSSDSGYYKWTQWFFLLLYKNGLAYKKKAKVNWCDSCQTVLANEQAEGGICDRCKNSVAQKDLEQWFFKITDFIENRGKTAGLIDGLNKVDWPESTKAAQKNWIGKSEGAQFRMKVKNSNLEIEFYTTRIDTVFGMTYAVMAPEHPVMEKFKNNIKNLAEVSQYIAESKKKTELQRMADTKEKTGVKLEGVELINPFNNQAIPLFVGDYILAHYGTGAVMAVPGHDKRDYKFAKKYNLEIREVIKSVDGKSSIEKESFADDGILLNSNEFNGLTSEEARQKITKWLEEKKIGFRKVNYKIRDWLVSRQRYWGAPIPILYCAKCGEVPVAEKDLPVELPTDVDFMPTGESPLVKSKSFHQAKCPVCGGDARRESDTMDTFVCSSWYYFRYSDPKNKTAFASKEMMKKWLPVDLYVGGAEHTVLHLLYSRFFTKVLHSLGYIDFDEPFTKMRHQGIILAEDGRKMSKSLGNVVNPDDVVKQYGADALRLFEMFMGPLEDMKSWNTKGIIGQVRFLEKTWDCIFRNYTGLFISDEDRLNWVNGKDQAGTPAEIKILLNKTIKKVTEDIEALKFNTAISQLMIFRNSFYRIEETIQHKVGNTKAGIGGIFSRRINKEDFEKFLILLAPFAPHFAEEIWQNKKLLNHKESIFKQPWPEYDKNLVKDKTINLVVQINGKVRDIIEVSADISENEAKKIVLTSEKIKKWLEGRDVVKVIFIKGKLVNIVI